MYNICVEWLPSEKKFFKNRNIIPYMGFNRVFLRRAGAIRARIRDTEEKGQERPFPQKNGEGGLFVIRFADKFEVADAQTAVMLDAAQIFADAYDFDIDEVICLLRSGRFATAVDDVARGVYANRILQYEELGHAKATEAADLLESYIDGLRKAA